MDASNIYSLKLDTLMVIFFNCSQSNDGNFLVKSTYRETKFLPVENDSYRSTSLQLSFKYGIEFNVSGTTLYAVIYNNERITLDDFLERVYRCILVQISNVAFNYNLEKFNNDGYGKNIAVLDSHHRSP